MKLALGLNISNPQISDYYKKEIDDAMANFWLPKTLANPKAYKWCTNWEIVLKSANMSVGGMGFNGEPNEKSEAEIGYMINEQHQNKGYATEALKLLTRWAFTQDAIKAIIVHTYADNLPSVKILSKCGFEVEGKDDEGLLNYKLTRVP